MHNYLQRKSNFPQRKMQQRWICGTEQKKRWCKCKKATDTFGSKMYQDAAPKKAWGNYSGLTEWLQPGAYCNRAVRLQGKDEAVERRKK